MCCISFVTVFFRTFITLIRCDMFALRCYQCFFQVLLGNISVEIAHAQYYNKIDEIPNLYLCCLGRDV